MAEENQHIILPTSNNDERKIIRREVERKRRTHMSSLCASLRSSLPFQLIKGKRSVSDLIGEAANYVQFKKEKIDALQIKRERLKLIMDANPSLLEIPNNHSSSSSAQDKCTFNINTVPGGLEINICSSSFEECTALPLSILIQILIEEGCDVVSCVSTQVHGKTFHTLKSQVEDLTSIDVAKLQHKLNHTILFHAGGKYSS